MDSSSIRACFHCGQPVPPQALWHTRVFDVLQPMCCAGCAAVAETIVANGLDSYYQTRHQSALPPSPSQDPLDLSELTLFDAPEIQPRYVRPATHRTDLSEADLMIEGLRCGACIWLIEQRLRRQPGICNVVVNYTNERAQVQWDPQQLNFSTLLQAIHNIGYRARPFDQLQQQQQQQQQRKRLFRQWFIAGIGMMQVMMYAWPAYITETGEIEAEYSTLLRWASLLLTLPVVLYSARDFFRGAWRDLKHRTVGMDVPVALGIAAAFSASLLHTLQQQGDVYFDSITMFVFLLLSSRWLELHARSQATASLTALTTAQPTAAHRLKNGAAQRDTETIPALRLNTGDHVLIPAGEAIPADIRIIEGCSRIDQSLLTGEAELQTRDVGSFCPGGAINHDQPLIGEVLHAHHDSTLSQIERLAQQAQQHRPRLAQLADRVAAYFVAGLLLITALTYQYWLRIDPNLALPIAIALLVVSCPCALSLATPTALAAATGSLLKRGVLVCRSDALEKLAQITDVVFDKTGTLTELQRQLLALEILATPEQSQSPSAALRERENLLTLAAALEQGVRHPIAEALLQAQRRTGYPLPSVTELTVMHGQGVSGWIDGQHFRIGHHHFVADLVGDHNSLSGPMDRAGVWLGRPGQWLACFKFSDTLRPDAQTVVQALHAAGKTIHLFSGDQADHVTPIARQLQIDDARGDMTPASKLAAVKALQQQGRCVAMVGDGSNDAPVISGADVSIAMGKGTPLAQLHADVILLGNDLAALHQLMPHADKTLRIIRQNLGWATLYNLVAIPTAAFGFITPWGAALGMSLSSLCVVLNALRLLKIRQPILP